MRTLSGQLFRIAVLAAVATMAVMYLADWIGWSLLESKMATIMGNRDPDKLPPAILAQVEALTDQYSSVILPAAAVLGVIVGGVVGVLHARHFVVPLTALAGAARRMRTGALDVRVPTGMSKVREIEQFVADFNDMAAAVERAERERVETSAAIAHELRTPLTVLTGRLNGMLDGVFAPDRPGLEGLLTQTELLARIVDDLRLLTLAHAGQLALQCGPTDMADEARSLLAGADPLLAAGSTSLETDLQPAPVHADGARLQQALQALLSNALRYGAGPIRIETGREGETAFLRVLDRGPGLRAGDGERAFDRFWRAESSRGREGGGSGLGLSIVQAIADAHHGRAAYRDRPGGGAVFEVRIPARAPSALGA